MPEAGNNLIELLDLFPALARFRDELHSCLDFLVGLTRWLGLSTILSIMWAHE